MELIKKLIENQAILIQSQFELSTAHKILCSEIIATGKNVIIKSQNLSEQPLIEDFGMPPVMLYDLDALTLHEITACAVLLKGSAFNEYDLQGIAQAAIDISKSKDAPEAIDRIYMTITDLANVHKLDTQQRYELCANLYHDWDNRKATKKTPNPHKDFADHFISSQLGTLVSKESVIPDEEVIEAPSTETEKLDYVALRTKITQLISQLVKGGYRTEALEILDKFGAKKVPELKDEDLAEAIESTEQVLSGDA